MNNLTESQSFAQHIVRRLKKSLVFTIRVARFVKQQTEKPLVVEPTLKEYETVNIRQRGNIAPFAVDRLLL